MNVAQHAQLPAGKRAKGLIRTAERVAEWEHTAEKPSPVMVGTPEQTAAFLVHADGDRLYPLFPLMAFRGQRRGEACDPRQWDINWEAGTLTLAKQLVEHNWQVYEDDPKTQAGARTIALDSTTLAVLEQHRERQEQERRHLGSGWTMTGRVFVAEDGTWLRPSHLTQRFTTLYEAAGLPPIRLHDLRHGAATLRVPRLSGSCVIGEGGHVSRAPQKPRLTLPHWAGQIAALMSNVDVKRPSPFPARGVCAGGRRRFRTADPCFVRAVLYP